MAHEYKFTGSKYVGGRDITEIAKLVRADIKAAIKGKLLPAIKTSVRIQRFSGGRSLSVKITAFPETFCAYVANCHLSNQDSRYIVNSDELKQLLKDLKHILDSYNFDDSDTMTDYFHVNFYGSVDVDWKQESVLIAIAKKQAEGQQKCSELGWPQTPENIQVAFDLLQETA
jgi:hypothetical protein